MQSFLGDRAIESISRQEIGAFLQALAQLPRHYGQLPAFRDKTLQDMVVVGTQLTGPRLSRKTLNRHASAVSGLFGWAKKHGHLSGESPASGFVDKRSSGRTGPKRRPWGREDLNRLFAELLRLREPQPDGVCSEKLMVPLIALYSGLRLEEICKLTVDDVRQDGAIWAIDVVGNEAGPVKEESSNRTVPVHSILIRFGLIEHVRAIKVRGGRSLWPALERQGPDEKFGWSLGKWFTRFCTKIGVKEPGLTFHSLRKNLASALHSAGVGETTTADILGHAHKTLSYRLYSHGPSLRVLHEEIEKVEYGIDIEQVDVLATGRPSSDDTRSRSRHTTARRAIRSSAPGKPLIDRSRVSSEKSATSEPAGSAESSAAGCPRHSRSRGQGRAADVAT